MTKPETRCPELTSVRGREALEVERGISGPSKGFRRILFVALALALGAGGFGDTRVSAEPQQVNPAAEARQRDLEEIRRQVRELESKLAKVEDSAAGISGQLARTEVELELQEKRLLEARTAGEQAAEEVREAGLQVEELETRLGERRSTLRSRLRGLYRLGGLGYVRMLFSIEAGSEPLQAVRTLRYMARRDGEAIRRFQETREELTRQQARLLEEQARVEEWADAEAARRQELAAVRRRQSALLRRLEDEQNRLAREAEALKEKERKLGILLEELARENESSLSGAPIQEFKGVLDWPIEGKILKGFGTVLDPRYGTRLPHNGVDIEVGGEGLSVRVIYPGKVLFAGPFEGYGSMVVVLHKDRVFSIYTGLHDLQVEQGGVLSLSQVVGYADHVLYFEIRAENLPQDPLVWLR
ncbi:MAG: peptidoglycan DD-metalloendopeptidase family protein [Acidobacteria bacterium]|nr:peptidoglycan DD-metalloendopeptidase family protein [Acidobacteriota bacterium]